MTETFSNLAVLTLIKAITVVLGLIVMYQGSKAYRATRRKSLLLLTIGMAIMTLGAVSEALAYRGLELLLGRDFQWTLDQSHLFEAIVTLVGFAVLVYSLYTRE